MPPHHSFFTKSGERKKESEKSHGKRKNISDARPPDTTASLLTKKKKKKSSLDGIKPWLTVKHQNEPDKEVIQKELIESNEFREFRGIKWNFDATKHMAGMMNTCRLDSFLTAFHFLDRND